jgi:hypothetical protein
LSIAAAGLVLLGAETLPLDENRHVVVNPQTATEEKTLSAGERIQQKFTARYRQYTGLRIFTYDSSLSGQKINVLVFDDKHRQVSRGGDISIHYSQPQDTPRLEISLSPFSTTVGKQYTVQFDLASGPPLHLRSIARGDIALVLLSPERLPFGGRHGAMAGVVFFLGFLLIYYFVSEKYRWWAAGALLVATVPLAWGGFWYSYNQLGIADWDYYFSLHENYRQIILHYHSFPFWNPYTCGGSAGLGDPEFPGFTPTFLLELIFGIPAGLRLAIFLSLSVLSVGALLLAKRLRLSLPAATIVALGVAFSSVSRLEIVEGHVNQFAAMWIPWIFWAWLAAYRADSKLFAVNRWTLATAIFLALTFFGGGIYLLMYTFLALLLLNVLVRRPWAAARVSLTAAAWSLGMVAVKLLPVLAWLHQFKSVRYAASAYTLPYLQDIFLGRYLHGAYVIFRQNTGWQEYGAYIGPFIFLLVLVALFQIGRQRLVGRLAIAAVLAILIASTGPILKPYFDHMPFFPRSTVSRIVVYAVYALSLLAGIGLDIIRTRVPKAAFLIPFIIGAVAVDLMSLDYQLSEQAFILPHVATPIAPAPAPIAFTTKRYDSTGDDNRQTRTYDATLAGYGTTAYCTVLSPMPMVQTIFDENRGPILLAKDSQAKITLITWLPNRVEAKVDAPAATQIVLNTNYAEGWLANNQPASIVDGRVGASVPAGNNQTIVFRYAAPGFLPGLGISLLTAAATVGYLWQTRRKTAGQEKESTAS